ncbi:acyltransferase family protein [Armatimonas rosea]|uniref:Peptidoglycan/LPS O-acetylase OafA/YrhL n=1 Tax=Armatimonas rosea TaxID=685828 RepID=A0A7W9SSS5_ARMRO|nr:acyltransferase [Armatimonas rosea]MBB6051593.1 peptidoglycan/LPS O-acetylase OafA/YrhL [Armatimonas rosea]
MNTPPPRLSYATLDAWRGIASLMVVCFHTAGVHALHHPELKDRGIFWLAQFGWLGVQLFFVISGFCIANAAAISQARDPGVGSFFVARLRRIFPPYWCALLLTTLPLVVMQLRGAGTAETAGMLTGGNIFWNLTLTQLITKTPSIVAVSWTLCFELAFYLLVGGALAAFGKRLGVRAMLRALHGLTLLCLIAQLIFGDAVPYPFCMWAQFGFGVLVYDALTDPKSREPRVWAAVLALATLVLITTRDFYVANQPYRLSMVVTLLFAALLVGLHRFDTLTGAHRALRGLSVIGGFSYSLYLTHHYLLRIGLQIFERLRLPDPGGLVGLLFAIAFSVATAAVFYRFCEKPFLKKRPTKSL